MLVKKVWQLTPWPSQGPFPFQLIALLYKYLFLNDFARLESLNTKLNERIRFKLKIVIVKL